MKLVHIATSKPRKILKPEEQPRERNTIGNGQRHPKQKQEKKLFCSLSGILLTNCHPHPTRTRCQPHGVICWILTYLTFENMLTLLLRICQLSAIMESIFTTRAPNLLYILNTLLDRYGQNTECSVPYISRWCRNGKWIFIHDLYSPMCRKS